LDARNILTVINSSTNREHPFNNEIFDNILDLSDKHSAAGGLRNQHGSIHKKITFTNCEFKDNIEITFSLVDITFEFDDCVFHSQFEMSVVKSLSFRNCKFLKKSSLNLQSESNLIFNTNFISGDFKLTSTLNKHYFENIYFEQLGGKLIIIAPGAHELKFSNCFLNDVEFQNSNCRLLLIENSVLEKITFFGHNFGQLVFISSILEKIDFGSALKNISLIISNSIISHFQIVAQTISNLHIDHSTFWLLRFVGNSPEISEYQIEWVDCKILSLNRFKSKSEIEFSYVKVVSKGSLSFVNSDFKGMKFINCEFADSVLEFENSQLEMFTAETNFPVNVKTNGLFNRWSQAQLAFGQLAKSYDAQGDTVRHLDYKSRELHAHMRKLNFKEDPSAFLNLWANYLSNNFGRNWIQCAAITLILGAISFYLIVVSSNNYSIGFGWHVDTRILNSFFHFFNPIRDTDTNKVFEIDGKQYIKLTRRSYVLDFFAHILLAFLFYQTISAFRRFGKSN